MIVAPTQDAGECHSMKVRLRVLYLLVVKSGIVPERTLDWAEGQGKVL